MTLLVVGLLIWTLAHMFKRLAPGARAALDDRFGPAAKGIFGAVLLASVVLMVLGYRAAPFSPVYELPSWGVHLNNLLMLVAVALMGVGNSKSRLRGKLRNPMLTGTLVWAVAHLLVNGDAASVLLFVWMALWALGEMVLINRADPTPAPYAGSVAGDVRLALITLVVFAVIGGIHTWIGPSPFPG
ncbi:MAG: hypothetical protein HUJ27_13335 [Rhodobacteraceae bacterium]|nr:hypothetical protein [Paracoccaceae bacterium]